jgi:hypothetical protein
MPIPTDLTVRRHRIASAGRQRRGPTRALMVDARTRAPAFPLVGVGFSLPNAPEPAAMIEKWPDPFS